MDKKIKLVWDFFGPESEEFANHHEKHLRQFLLKEQINSFGTGVEVANAAQHFAYLIIDRENMIIVRDALKPTRGFEVSL